MVMNFKNMDNSNLNVRMDFWSIILFRLGFEKLAINRTMKEWNLDDYVHMYVGVTRG